MFGLSEASVVVIVVTLLGGGGLGVVLKFFIEKRQVPISEAQALSALAAQTSATTIAWANELQEDLARYRAEGEATRHQAEETHRQFEASRREFEDFRDQIKGRLNVWERWYEGLVQQWGEIRKSETPLAAPDTSEYTSLISAPYRYY